MSWATQFRMLTGIEVDILEDGSLDQDEDLLAGLDVVVASVHSKLAMDPPAMTDRMLAAIENPHTDISGTAPGRILAGRGRKPSRFDPDVMFEACARTGTAVEINSRPERGIRPSSCCGWRWDTDVCSASTPTPTPPVNWSGSNWVASRLPKHQFPRDGSSIAGTARSSSPGPGSRRPRGGTSFDERAGCREGRGLN